MVEFTNFPANSWGFPSIVCSLKTSTLWICFPKVLSFNFSITTCTSGNSGIIYNRTKCGRTLHQPLTEHLISWHFP